MSRSTRQRDGDRLAFIVGSAAAGRFILLGETELRVLRLLSGTFTAVEVCDEFKRLYGAKLTLPTLKKFLGRLDEAGILAGVRTSIAASSNLMPGPQFYIRWKLFNPDRLFERMIPALRWIWTPRFVVGSMLLALAALVFAVMDWPEVEGYALYAVREHYLAILIAGLLVGFSHEFAHGLTCRAFGGRVPEVGVLMIYYILPALYCNVSGAYLIPEFHRRLWVIAAGVYWQVLVGVTALHVWFIVEPHTLISDLAFIFFLGSVVDVIFNANPLIKLDGYYFLEPVDGAAEPDGPLPRILARPAEESSFWRKRRQTRASEHARAGHLRRVRTNVVCLHDRATDCDCLLRRLIPGRSIQPRRIRGCSRAERFLHAQAARADDFSESRHGKACL